MSDRSPYLLDAKVYVPVQMEVSGVDLVDISVGRIVSERVMWDVIVQGEFFLLLDAVNVCIRRFVL